MEEAEAWLRRLERWELNLRRDLEKDSVPAPNGSGKRWLFYVPDNSEEGHGSDDPAAGMLQLPLCQTCRECLAQRTVQGEPLPKLPPQARANGLWGGPDPDELSCLTLAERKAIQLARVYVCVKRVFLDRRNYAAGSRGETPLYHERNVVAYPENHEMCNLVLGHGPEALAQFLMVQFVGDDPAMLRNEPALQVSVTRLRAAFAWLAYNSYPWMVATKYQRIAGANLGAALESLLAAYEASTGSSNGGVPASIIQTATRIPAEHVPAQQAGPSDAVADNDDEAAPPSQTPAEGESAACLSGGTDDISPLQLWDSPMKKHDVQNKLDADLAQLSAEERKTQEGLLRFKMAQAAADAVYLLRKLTAKEAREKLEAANARLATKGAECLSVTHTSELLSNFHPDFWVSCFLDLFPRGDCQEKSLRPKALNSNLWAKTLIDRGDFKRWRRCLEFVASTYNVLLRREQLQAVSLFIKFHGDRVAGELAAVSYQDIVAQMMSSGECDSVRELLRKKGNLDLKLRKMFDSMQAVQRDVRGSEAEKDKLRHAFTAMRIWNGFSSLFFTLNPNDVKSPLTICFADEARFQLQKFSLDVHTSYLLLMSVCTSIAG